MKTSARNQLQGVIKEIIGGKVNDEIVIAVDGGLLKAIISREAVEDMDLAVGQDIYAIIKASFVIVSKDKPGKISTRNVLETTVNDIIHGAVNCELKLSMNGAIITSIITEDAVKDLEIKLGDTVYALIKANSIILAQ